MTEELKTKIKEVKDIEKQIKILERKRDELIHKEIYNLYTMADLEQEG